MSVEKLELYTHCIQKNVAEKENNTSFSEKIAILLFYVVVSSFFVLYSLNCKTKIANIELWPDGLKRRKYLKSISLRRALKLLILLISFQIQLYFLSLFITIITVYSTFSVSLKKNIPGNESEKVCCTNWKFPTAWKCRPTLITIILDSESCQWNFATHLSKLARLLLL